MPLQLKSTDAGCDDATRPGYTVLSVSWQSKPRHESPRSVDSVEKRSSSRSTIGSCRFPILLMRALRKSHGVSFAPCAASLASKVRRAAGVRRGSVGAGKSMHVG
eukprot:Amastigsp_a844187_23.p4 type:complete len:105 gc:universal Amastigsp_a844187_23:767-453(-)